MLDWVSEPNSSWSLSLDVERVSSKQTELEVGVEQIRRLCQTSGPCEHGLDIVSADAKYSNHPFLEALKDLPCGKVVRLRKDRILYRPVPGRKPGKRGRPLASMVRVLLSKSLTCGVKRMNLPGFSTRAGDRSRSGAGMIYMPCSRWTPGLTSFRCRPIWKRLNHLHPRGLPGDVDVLPSTTDRAGSAPALAAAATRSYAGKGKERHRSGFSRD